MILAVDVTVPSQERKFAKSMCKSAFVYKLIVCMDGCTYYIVVSIEIFLFWS